LSATSCASSVAKITRLSYSAAPRFTTSQQGMMPSGRRCSYFQSFLPVPASSANRREYEPVTNILPLWIKGCDSWPRCFSPPKENAHTGASLATLLVFTCLSGE
jgi:hypothetical protein